MFLNPNYNSVASNEVVLGLTEFILLNWMLSFIRGFYFFIAIIIGNHLPNLFSNSQGSTEHISFEGLNSLVNFVGKIYQYSLYSHGIEIVFYPIILFFAYRFWMAILQFFFELFSLKNGYGDEEIKSLCHRVIQRSFSANFLTLIPIVGNALSYCLFCVYFYLGLRKQCQFSNIQALSFLFIPLVITGCATLLLLIYGILVLRLLF